MVNILGSTFISNSDDSDISIQYEILVILHNCCIISSNFVNYIYKTEHIKIYHMLLNSSNSEIQNLTIKIITLISESSEDGCMVLNQMNNTFILISKLILQTKETLKDDVNIMLLNYFNSLVKWKGFRTNEYVN